MKAYKFRGEVSKEDLLMSNSPINSSFNSIAMIFVFLVSGFVFLEFEDMSSFIRVLLTLISMPLSYAFLYGFVSLPLRIAVNKRKVPLPIIDLLIDEIGIHGEQSNDFSFLIKWDRIKRIKENKNYLIIQTKKKERIVIPKRYFDTADDLAEVQSFMEKHVRGSNRL